MELIFQENQVAYLNRIIHETVSLEQTADIIVPDSMSDIDRVVDAFGTVLVRSEECTASGVSVDGVVNAGVLFVGEDGIVQKISAQIPFAVRREFPAQQEECTMQCKCAVRSVDARALNSRKLLVRVGVVCTLSAYAQSDCTCYDLPEAAPNLQLKRTQLPLSVPLALGEKNFVLNEELEMPNGKPMVDRLLKCVYQTQITEQKIVGDKAVFKGEVLLHALYESVDEKLVTCGWNVPFSQYVPLSQELEDCDVLTELALTSAEAEADMQANRILLSVGLLAQCTAFGQRNITLIEDAFCTDAIFEPQYHAFDMVGILDRQVFRDNVTATTDDAMGSVVDAWAYPEEVSRRREDGRMRLELPLNCNVLYLDEQGALQGKTVRTSMSAELALAEHGNCAVTQINLGNIYCSAGGGGLQLRVPTAMTVESSANHHFEAVSGGQIMPLPMQDGRRPSVILRRSDGQEELWQIAKACRTPVKSILEANGLQDETIPDGTMLLIPM